jgi:hypothetical protein
MAAAHVNERIDEERARQQRALRARIEQREREHTETAAAAASSAANNAAGGPAVDDDTAAAAVKIQAAWRGHHVRKQRHNGHALGKRKDPPAPSTTPPTITSHHALAKMKRVPTPDLEFSKVRVCFVLLLHAGFVFACNGVLVLARVVSLRGI